MEIKLNIPFEQLLQALAQLTPAQRRQAKAVLDHKPVGKASGVEGNFADLLLHGPVFSKEQLLRMEETRKAYAQWRGR